MEAIATAAVKALLAKLAGLLIGEYRLQRGVRKNIRLLEAELEHMHAALRKMSEAPIDQPPDSRDKLWAREARELSYDIEDCIDKFFVRLDHVPNQHQPTRGRLRALAGRCRTLLTDRSLNVVSQAVFRRRIGTRAKDIMGRIEEVSGRRHRWWYNKPSDPAAADKPSGNNGRSADSLRQSALYKDVAHLVGIEEKSNDLIERLMEEEGDASAQRQRRVISIVGAGGLGKTTLARAVYAKCKWKFDCGAIVYISRSPVMTNIFKSMLRQLCKARYGNINGETWDEGQLKEELRDFLRNERYIIIIDDIWTKSVCNNILEALVENKLGSIIITTTRIADVVQQANGVYQLNPLSPDDSRKLFYRTIFRTEDKRLPNELVNASEGILRKCGGVPLAIMTIGSMLASKEVNTQYWSTVYKSMGSGLENSSDELKDMRTILAVSYYDLPPHLKTCMLYLSLYPEDYEINTQYLIRKWICEFFILKEQEDMFEVGEEYIKELANRNMIQLLHIEDDSTTRSCRIHDMVLDLISFLSNEDHFITKLGGHQQPKSLPNKIRRLSLQTRNEEDDRKLATMNFSHVRSLVAFSGTFNSFPKLSSFPVLRVLDLTNGAKVSNHHFKYICKLFQLRYLALHSKSITEIPKEIGKLKFLQILDISGTKIVELAPSFVQLQQLICLRFDNLVSIPDGFRYLKSLQELVGDIHLNSPEMLHVLGELTELRRVGLLFNDWDESYEKPFLSWLSSMVSLKYLSINGSANTDLGSSCDNLSPGPQQLRAIQIRRAICFVPGWMSSLSSLSILHISLVTLGERDLQILGSIPCLSHLAIMVKEPTQSRDKRLVVSKVYPFLFLRKLEITNTVEVMFAQGSMQNLETLVLGFEIRKMLDQFDNFNLNLENLSSLQKVFVRMICRGTMPGEVKDAEAAIQKTVDMNPNKPTLILDKISSFKVDLGCGRCRAKALAVVRKIAGVRSIIIDDEKGVMTVCGSVDPISISEKLKEAEICACDMPYGVMLGTNISSLRL